MLTKQQRDEWVEFLRDHQTFNQRYRFPEKAERFHQIAAWLEAQPVQDDEDSEGFETVIRAKFVSENE